jgi:hypothetical protein
MLKSFSQFLTEETEESTPNVKVYCDLDGVLVDFNRGFKRLDANEDKLSPTEYEEKYGLEKMWSIIDDEGESFWANLRWKKDGRALWDYIRRYDPIILSSPSRSKSSIEGKMKWIKRNLGINQSEPTKSSKKWEDDSRIILSRYKYKFAKGPTDILIDDTREKIDKWVDAGGTGVLHTDSTDSIRVIEDIITSLGKK